jgi:hypothetical protein
MPVALDAACRSHPSLRRGRRGAALLRIAPNRAGTAPNRDRSAGRSASLAGASRWPRIRSVKTVVARRFHVHRPSVLLAAVNPMRDSSVAAVPASMLRNSLDPLIYFRRR